MPEPKPMLKEVEARVIFYHPVNRRRDRSNSIQSLKALTDGLVDSGLLEDDSGIRWPSVEYAKGEPGVIIEFTETFPGKDT